VFEVTETQLENLRKHCRVIKHNPFGLTIEEYEKGVFLVWGTVEQLNDVLQDNDQHPLKIKVILGEEN